MATIKFILQSKGQNAPIYARLSISAKESFKRKTRETINPDQWNPKTGKPKNIQAGTEETLKEIDNLKLKLKEIESFILEQYRKRNETEIINGIWLEEVLTANYNGGRKLSQLDYLDNYLEYYKTDVLPFRTNRGKRIADATTKKQITIINKINAFVKTGNRRLKVSDWNVSVSNKFEQFLDEQGIAKGTIGRYIKYPKTIINHAKTLNIEVSKNIDEIKGYTTETPTIFLTEKELRDIQQLTFLEPQLETAKDWLIIGFYTGQRASDLLQMTPKMFTNIDGHTFINLHQQKTKNGVLIPMHDEVKKIIEKRNGQFPPVFSANIESAKTIFNNHLRTIAKKAEINRLDFGKKFDPKSKRFVYGQYPLCEIISSHVCRRSFATHNYIKVPTPIIMAVTGHKTEKEFLNYIGKDFNDQSKEILNYWNHPGTAPESPEKTKTAN
ncbi:tyrosine-type recombinase/integrase [Chryseobacterium sp. L7]|uniref:Tyrosine-type recombinase/integrase n=1 Tax=Chryseobacterium endalhagicum TaxID=2797638 RepID=A0ABS1QAR1_9FLAO|nr:tyrosine-type recombinase/integrase [Chryseobacterium endalhagicum]MBL1219372.1 tyrosine-type recombinase/integrase [Chryseobacterium endalhagicum]